MSAFLAMRALLFAGEMLAASALVVALASLTIFRKTASRRHLVWLAAFAVLLVLPVLAAVAPSIIRVAIAAPAVPVAPVADAMSAVLPPADPGPDYVSVENLALAALALWLAGVCMIALRGLVAAFYLHALRRQSVAHDLGDLPQIDPRCELRISTADESCGPVTWGFLRPVILLPRNFVFWPRERLDAVLLHEMAHIRRYDSLAQMLSLFVCALYWPNPLVWMGARALRREAEMAADDAVIVAGIRPSAYAGELLQLASEFLTQGPSTATALFMAAPSALEARVQSVLAPTQQRSGVTKMDVLKIACAGLLATSALVLARPSFAQDAPQMPAVSSAEAAPSAPAVAVTPLAPPAPAATAVPSTPPAPPAPAGEATPSAPSISVISSDEPGDANVRVREELRTVNGRQIRRVRMTVTSAKLEAQQAREEIARVRPEIEKAIAEAKISAQAAQAVRDAQPQIDEAMRQARPEIDKALAEVRTDLAKAHLDVKIRERVDAALKRVEIRVQARDANRKDSGHDVVIEDSDAPARK
jgi:beta-lactamase regulating signal transducer with metallopeptidase domain